MNKYCRLQRRQNLWRGVPRKYAARVCLLVSILCKICFSSECLTANLLNFWWINIVDSRDDKTCEGEGTLELVLLGGWLKNKGTYFIFCSRKRNCEWCWCLHNTYSYKFCWSILVLFCLNLFCPLFLFLQLEQLIVSLWWWWIRDYGTLFLYWFVFLLIIYLFWFVYRLLVL